MRRLAVFVLMLVFSSLTLKSQDLYINLFNAEYDYHCDMPLALNLSFKADYANDTKAVVVLSAEKDNSSVYWQSFGLQHDFNLNILIPSRVMNNTVLKCYIYNQDLDIIKIKNLKHSLAEEKLPSYLPDNLNVMASQGSFEAIPKIDGNDSEIGNMFRAYYSDEEKFLKFGDDFGCMTNPVSVYLNDNQSFKWDVKDLFTFVNENSQARTDMTISFDEASPNVHFEVYTEFLEDTEISRYALIIPFIGDNFVVYRANMKADSANFQDEYYLDKEGFTYRFNDYQLNFYHPKELSSMQLDKKNRTAVLNFDYEKDHPLIHYPAKIDTLEYFVDKSKKVMKKGDVMNSSFDISLTKVVDLPRIMPIWNGYESSIIWTEHADWTDIRTHRAVCFGNEDVTCADSAVGGFVYYGIPVTKSVFYNNPANVLNLCKNRDFPGPHATIEGDSVYFDFLKQLNDKGFEICLHTPEQYTTWRGNLSKALSFMSEHFGSPTWIDHGYNNTYGNNREDLVCDGLNPKSPYYAYDLWKENGVRYLWNAYYEEAKPFDKWIFDNNLQRPYPFWGDAFPKPRFMHTPFDSDLILWTTEYTTEPGEAWNYFYSQHYLDAVVESRSAFITHMYSAWVTTARGFWDMEDGKVIAKEDFNRALERIANLREQRLMLPTTIDKYLSYQEQLQKIDYQFDTLGNAVLRNDNEETVHGITLISKSPIKVLEKDVESRMSNGEYMIWFDIEPYETVTINNCKTVDNQ